MLNSLKNNDNSVQSHHRIMEGGLVGGIQQVSVGITKAIPDIVRNTENLIEDIRRLISWQPTL